MRRRLTDRYTQALTYAAETHADQVRKGPDKIPYISHLLAASSLVLEAGGTEDEAIAALLHDAAEDQGGEARLVDIEKHFGATVAGIVRECSDSLSDDPGAKEDWVVRKTHYLEHLKTATPSALLVTAADKTHNARSLATDVQLEGVSYLNLFTATTEQTLWYYEQVLAILSERGVSQRLVRTLASNIQQIKDLIEIEGLICVGEVEHRTQYFRWGHNLMRFIFNDEGLHEHRFLQDSGTWESTNDLSRLYYKGDTQLDEITEDEARAFLPEAFDE
jgi:(p)ppGpp synthase/HD superfamily hydrolase